MVAVSAVLQASRESVRDVTGWTGFQRRVQPIQATLTVQGCALPDRRTRSRVFSTNSHQRGKTKTLKPDLYAGEPAIE